MTITVAATFENGVFRPKESIALAEGAEVRLAISARDQEPSVENGDPFAGLIGTYSSGRTDGASHHDKYIYGDPR